MTKVRGKQIDGVEVLVERIQSTSNGASLTFSGLNGNTDRVYRLVWNWRSNASGLLTIRPNNLSTNLSSRWVEPSNNFSDTADASNAVIARSAAANADVFGEARFFAWTGSFSNKRRGGFSRFLRLPSGGGVQGQGFASFEWNQTSTNVTSLVIQLTAGSYINGIDISLYKMAGST